MSGWLRYRNHTSRGSLDVENCSPFASATLSALPPSLAVLPSFDDVRLSKDFFPLSGNTGEVQFTIDFFTYVDHLVCVGLVLMKR